MAKKKKQSGGLRRTLIVLSIVLGVILAALIAATVYADYLLGKVNYLDKNATAPTLSQEELEALMNETEPEDPDFTGPELNEEDVLLETAPTMGETSENVVTILLIGADSTDGKNARSDSIILCTLNKTQNTISLTSLLRDMYVRIPGYKSNRINASFAAGGTALLEKTLEQNFGIKPDGVVMIDFSHFEKLIDLLGGIELDLTYAEAKFVNFKAKCSLGTGVQTLNGKQALWYSRFRGTAAGDLARTNRQRVVLTTLLNEYKSKSMTELLGLLDDILPMVTTDMTQDEILGYVKAFFPMLAKAEIQSNRIPVEGAYYQARINGMAVIVPDIAKNSAELHRILSEFPEGVG